jgi:hypothetical protein
MRIIQEPKKVALRNKWYFEEKKTGECAACLKIQYVYLLKKHKKWGFWRVAVCPSYI